MFKIDDITGYYVRNHPNGKISIEYFIFGINNKLYHSKQFYLLNKIISNSFNYGDLYKKLELNNIGYYKYDKIKTSKIKEYATPEILPHLNSKYIECILKFNEENIYLHLFSINNDNINNLFIFLEKQLEIDINKIIKKNDILINKKENNEFESKMKLIINKINYDNTNNFQEEEKYVIDEDVDNDSENFVKLNNGSLYSGEIKNNKPDGKGKEFLKDQTSYVGKFNNGNWEGEGYISDNKNDICYGEFYKGNLIGI